MISRISHHWDIVLCKKKIWWKQKQRYYYKLCKFVVICIFFFPLSLHYSNITLLLHTHTFYYLLYTITYIRKRKCYLQSYTYQKKKPNVIKHTHNFCLLWRRWKIWLVIMKMVKYFIWWCYTFWTTYCTFNNIFTHIPIYFNAVENFLFQIRYIYIWCKNFG